MSGLFELSQMRRIQPAQLTRSCRAHADQVDAHRHGVNMEAGPSIGVATLQIVVHLTAIFMR